MTGSSVCRVMVGTTLGLSGILNWIVSRPGCLLASRMAQRSEPLRPLSSVVVTEIVAGTKRRSTGSSAGRYRGRDRGRWRRRVGTKRLAAREIIAGRSGGFHIGLGSFSERRSENPARRALGVDRRENRCQIV